MDMMSPSIAKLTEAMGKAKDSIGPILKNKEVKTGSFSYDYADLPTIEEAIKEALKENGLYVFQPINIIEGKRCLVTILSHVSGEWIKGMIDLSPSNGKMQDAGKEITYFRRYSLCSMISLCAEDDTDGNEIVGKDKHPTPPKQAAPKPVALNTIDAAQPQTLSESQVKTIKGLIINYPEIREEVLKFTGKKLVQDIESTRFDEVIKFIQKFIKLKTSMEGAA